MEGFLTFLSKAEDPIQRFSESTCIGALIKACKTMKIKKKPNSFSSNHHTYSLLPIHPGTSERSDGTFEVFQWKNEVNNLSIGIDHWHIRKWIFNVLFPFCQKVGNSHLSWLYLCSLCSRKLMLELFLCFLRNVNVREKRIFL